MIVGDSALDALYPPVLELTRQFGNGRIYEVPESIDYPQDQMSWMETIQLAKRLSEAGSGKDGVAGLEMLIPIPFFIDTVRKMNGLSVFNATGKANLQLAEQ